MAASNNNTREGRRWPAVVYCLLVAVGIPWYWPQHDTTLILGVPAWVAVAIGVSALASVFTAWLLRAPWDAEESSEAAE